MPRQHPLRLPVSSSSRAGLIETPGQAWCLSKISPTDVKLSSGPSHPLMLRSLPRIETTADLNYDQRETILNVYGASVACRP